MLIPLARCEIPVVKTNVIVELNHNLSNGSVMVFYYCNGSSGSNTNVITSVCTEAGNWIPNPTDYTCEYLPKLNGTHNLNIVKVPRTSMKEGNACEQAITSQLI